MDQSKTDPGTPTGRSLGGSFDPLGVHLQDPYPFYARARREGPVFWSPVVNAWVLTRYEDIRDVLRDPETFSSRNALRPLRRPPPAVADVLRQGYPIDPPGLLLADAETHRELRAPVARGLSPARVEAAEPFIRQKATELVDAFNGDGHADLMSQYAFLLPVSVIAHLCALEPDDEPVLFAASYQANRTNFLAGPEAEHVEAAREGLKLHRLVGRYLHARRAEPGVDLISDVVTALAPAGEPLPFQREAQIARTIHTLMLAGHVTTSSLIGSAVRYLLADRKQWELLLERPDLIPNAVEETVRYDNPTPGFLRRATREVTLGGHTLPAGSEVWVPYPAANRDPDLCERPDEFDVTRDPVHHLGFGTGPHACVGALLGRREAEITLEVLTRRLPDLRLVDGQDFAMEGTATVRSLAALHLTW